MFCLFSYANHVNVLGGNLSQVPVVLSFTPDSILVNVPKDFAGIVTLSIINNS